MQGFFVVSSHMATVAEFPKEQITIDMVVTLVTFCEIKIAKGKKRRGRTILLQARLKYCRNLYSGCRWGCRLPAVMH